MSEDKTIREKKGWTFIYSSLIPFLISFLPVDEFIAEGLTMALLGLSIGLLMGGMVLLDVDTVKLRGFNREDSDLTRLKKAFREAGIKFEEETEDRTNLAVEDQSWEVCLWLDPNICSSGQTYFGFENGELKHIESI